MPLNIPRDNVPRNKLSHDNVPWDNVLRDNVPRDNCSLRQLFLMTIVSRVVPLQMVICKEDCPPDGQNQGDEGARIVANDHLDDSAFSVLLHSFANGHLQRGWFSG